MNYFKILWKFIIFRRNLKKSNEEIGKLQEKKLRKMIRYAYNHSTYYKEKFNEVGINIDNIDHMTLSSFPSIDKSILFERFDEIITVSDLTQESLRWFDKNEEVNRKAYKGKYHVIHSSGSTGKPSYFIYDEKAWDTMLLGIIRAALWDMSLLQILRFLAGKPRVVYIAATDGRYAGAMAVGDGIDGVGASQLYIDINTPLSEWITQIKKFNPNMIIGYPSAIKILGELVEKGELQLEIFRVISCGESLGASLRHYLESVFQTEVINIYGASESLAIGVETKHSEGMILFDDMNVIEIENDKMYLTSLYNFAQPLIRYKISDRFTLQEPDSQSPYPFNKAVGFIGRSEDILWFEDERGNREFLHPLAIEGFCIEGLIDFQFSQTDKDAFEMLAEISEAGVESAIRKEMVNQMKVILKEKKLEYVRFSVKFVDKIVPDPNTGKKRLIINNL